jgi:hypothetical protein
MAIGVANRFSIRFPSEQYGKSAIADAIVGESPSAKHCLPLNSYSDFDIPKLTNTLETLGKSYSVYDWLLIWLNRAPNSVRDFLSRLFPVATFSFNFGHEHRKTLKIALLQN